MVKRIYVEKKPEFSVEAKGLLKDLKENLLLENLEDLKIVNRYDVEGINDEIFEKAKNTVFSEPQVDECFEEEYPFAKEDKIFGEICNSDLYIDPKSGETSTTKKQGFSNGCGCVLRSKTRVKNAHCPIAR